MTLATNEQSAKVLIAQKLNALNTRLTTLEGGLILAKTPIYEYREIWAEENAAISANQAEYSFGNGAAGYIGIPHTGQSDWEVFAMYFNADIFADGSSATIACRQFLTDSNQISDEICDITVNSPTDGGGQINHSYKYVEFSPPKPLPHPNISAPIGFFTKSMTGTITDVRVGVRLRRKIGEAVIDVSFS